MRRVKVLLVSADPRARELMRLAVAGVERRLGSRLLFLEAPNGEVAVRVAWRESPDAIVADEIASRMGAFAMAKDLRGAEHPYTGAIVILLDRRQDVWLAEWSGADAWFVKPVDPFELADRVLGLVSAKEPA
jgi:DNA-binding response OmpR family regulator